MQRDAFKSGAHCCWRLLLNGWSDSFCRFHLTGVTHQPACLSICRAGEPQKNAVFPHAGLIEETSSCEQTVGVPACSGIASAQRLSRRCGTPKRNTARPWGGSRFSEISAGEQTCTHQPRAGSIQEKPRCCVVELTFLCIICKERSVAAC